MSEKSSGETKTSCGCCGCLFTVVFGIILISLLAGKFTINDTIWDLDLFPPGLHSISTELDVEPAKTTVKVKVAEKPTEAKPEPTEEKKPVRNENVVRKEW